MTKIRKRLSKKKEDTGKWEIDLEMHNAAQRQHPACIPPYPHSAYEEARQNKAYYDSCRQNVIDGERAERKRKSLIWLKGATILTGSTFCWSLTCMYLKVGGVFLDAAVITLGLAVVSTGVHLWFERKIKKLVNVK